MRTILQKIINEVSELPFKEKVQELRAFQAIRHFKQCGQIAPFEPESIQIQTHSFCNGRCLYCPYPETSQKLPQGRMEQQLIEKIAKEISTWKTYRQVTVMLQNEPFMDADFFKTVKYFKSLNPRIKICTVTNGTLLKPSMIKKIISSNLDSLTISLDAFSKSTYEKLHPGFSFENIMNSIQMLAHLKNKHLSVRLSFVDTNKNHHELLDFKKFARKHHMEYRTIQLLNRANSVKRYNKLKRSGVIWKTLKLRLIYKYFYQACNLPFLSMGILYNGDAILCCNDWRREAVIGNIHDESIDRIWNGKKMNFFRQKIVEKKYHEIRACSHCSMAQLSV